MQLLQVEAGFDEVRHCYIIRTLTPCHKYNQIFINYGPHSNKHLLLNYGFVTDNNPHDVCMVTTGNIRSCIGSETVFTSDKHLLMSSGHLVIVCDAFYCHFIVL